MENELKKVINEIVNPQLASHNGSCELVSLYDSVALIRMQGGCKGCPGRQMTFLNGIKPLLMENCDGLIDVILER